MTQITSHVLDTTIGRPATGIQITLYKVRLTDSEDQVDGKSEEKRLGSALTNADGRVTDFTGSTAALAAGTYKLTFELDGYFRRLGVQAFYPQADILFRISGDGQHYHVPLLLNPFGYSTYRGS